MRFESTFGKDQVTSLDHESKLSELMAFVAGLVSGYLVSRFISYFSRLFRQPSFNNVISPGLEEDYAAVNNRALEIATRNLRAGIETRQLPDGSEKTVLCAGRRNFREPWARDLSFASFGLVEIGEFTAARESFESFLLYQLPSGQFPVKMHTTGVIDRYLHSFFKREQPVRLHLHPKYITGHRTVSPDGNALLVIGMLNYARRSGDQEFIDEHWTGLKKAVQWLDEHALGVHGLLHQAAFADWSDTISRKGWILYTNILYWKALKDMSEAALWSGKEEDLEYFSAREAEIRRAINEYFWRADLGYYVTSERFANLSSSGNLLAIVWGLATSEQGQSILDRMKHFHMAEPVPTKPVYPPYPKRYVAIENRLSRLGFYHIKAAWLWLGALHAIALCRMDRPQEAGEILYRLSKVILRDGIVHEVYHPNGQFVSNFWYTSEAPFTWSAGVLVYALNVYRKCFHGEN